MTSIDINDIAFITGIIGLMGVVFTVYRFFRNPQIDTEKQDALQAQQIQWQKETNDKKFTEMGMRIDNTFAMAKNDISHVDAKVEVLITNDNKWHLEISNKLTELNTIINERIPKK